MQVLQRLLRFVVVEVVEICLEQHVPGKGADVPGRERALGEPAVHLARVDSGDADGTRGARRERQDREEQGERAHAPASGAPWLHAPILRRELRRIGLFVPGSRRLFGILALREGLDRWRRSRQVRRRSIFVLAVALLGVTTTATFAQRALTWTGGAIGGGWYAISTGVAELLHDKADFNV